VKPLERLRDFRSMFSISWLNQAIIQWAQLLRRHSRNEMAASSITTCQYRLLLLSSSTENEKSLLLVHSINVDARRDRRRRMTPHQTCVNALQEHGAGKQMKK
jgi:hypothetical protein